MKIGLFFGSFNPIHIGHLIIANYILNETDIDKIWFIVSPQNPLKQNNTLLNEYDRLHLVRLAVEDDLRLKESDIEFGLPRPSYTIDTLVYLTEKHPKHDFLIIMGSDSFQNIDKWKNFLQIINEHPICVYKREGFQIQNTYGGKITILDSPLIEVSATKIRELIKLGKSIRYLVPETVREEIETRQFYKKSIKKNNPR
jgi:nicotinate-nucleotide adenylyltransferase